MYIMYRSASTNGSIFFQGRDIRALRGGAVKEETDEHSPVEILTAKHWPNINQSQHCIIVHNTEESGGRQKNMQKE